MHEGPPLGRARNAVRRRLAPRAGAEGFVEIERRIDEIEERSAARHGEVLEALRLLERRQRRDIMTAMEKQAAVSSAELVQREMLGVAFHVHPHDTLRHAVAAATVPGMALEFGVATGTTLALIVEHHAHGPVHGFDSFEGLPEPWRPGWDQGEFAQPDLPEVPGAELVVGLFADTLPGFLAEHPGPVSFLHLDADLYSSTTLVLEQVGPRLVEGTVVLFDEYLNFPGWQEHEHRAWTEHVARTGLQWEYLGLTLDDEQVSMRVTKV